MKTILLLIPLLLAGCTSPPIAGSAARPGRTDEAADRQPQRAERLTQEAAGLIHSDPDRAASLLREALTMDIFCGPAHNNLGVLALERGDLYQAASEFECARKLMPGHPDPRMNLGTTLERAGRVEDAIAAYESALDVAPSHLPTVQAFARCQLRHDRADQRTPGWLKSIALEGEHARWREWAQRQAIAWSGRSP